MVPPLCFRGEHIVGPSWFCLEYLVLPLWINDETIVGPWCCRGGSMRVHGTAIVRPRPR